MICILEKCISFLILQLCFSYEDIQEKSKRNIWLSNQIVSEWADMFFEGISFSDKVNLWF